jgi:hypothetical protein
MNNTLPDLTDYLPEGHKNITYTRAEIEDALVNKYIN